MSDIVCIRGDTEFYDLTVTDELGARVDLTGSDLWFTVKVLSRDADIILQKTTTSGIVLADQNSQATRGMARITIDPADTEKLLAPKSYYFDVQRKSMGGVVTTVVTGTLSVTDDITKER